MKPAGPLVTAHLFAGINAKLIELLEGLDDDDWLHPTAAGHWRVRDVAAHLLDGDLRQISFRAHGQPPVEPPFPIESYADLVRFIDHLNATWVTALERVSPRLLTDLLRWSGPQVSEIFTNLDPLGDALFGVAWAGEAASENWFDTAREYTERWHHQQQIRDAVGAPPLDQRQWLGPVLETFVRVLPHAYRGKEAPVGTAIVLRVNGEAGGEWSVVRGEGGWSLFDGAPLHPLATLNTDQDTAWRFWTKGLSPDDASKRITIEGPTEFREPFLHAWAIMG